MSKGFFGRLKEGLTKTRDAIANRIDEIISYYKEIDDDFFDDLEATLISSDMGTMVACEIVEDVRQRVKKEKIGRPEDVKQLIRDAIVEKLGQNEDWQPKSPQIILMVGVNGAGKTTTAGKLAANFIAQGKSVLLVAADTFRAAAVEQLEEWSRRSGAPIVKGATGADPAAVTFDGLSAAKARGTDVIIIDTAGRLQNKKNLMNELEKIARIINKEWPQANRETFLVLDATTGQNAVSQAKVFSEAAEVTGLILTKLDGTAKGAVVVGITAEMSVPVRFIGVGEQIDDLQPFDAPAFAAAIL